MKDSLFPHTNYSQALGEPLEVWTETPTDHKSKQQPQGTPVVHQSQVPSSSFVVESFSKAGLGTVTATEQHWVLEFVYSLKYILLVKYCYHSLLQIPTLKTLYLISGI